LQAKFDGLRHTGTTAALADLSAPVRVRAACVVVIKSLPTVVLVLVNCDMPCWTRLHFSI
jgi:hypothetical protein